MRLIRNVYGEPASLIMRPRLRLARTLHLKLRFAIQSLFGREPSLPRYWRSEMSPEQQQQVREACREFIGGHSSDPAIAHDHKKRSRDALMDSPTCPEELKKQLCNDTT